LKKDIIFYFVTCLMPSSNKKSRKEEEEEEELSEATQKRIDQLPEHAQHIFKKAHSSAIEEYQDPNKRRGGKRESAEEVAHKVAWAAVKKEYKKQDDEWVKKDD
jgi:cation transport regulator